MRTVRVDLGEPVDVPILGMPRDVWSQFGDEHDLTDEDAYAPALIAACTGWDIDTAQEAWDDWPADAALSLLVACVEESVPNGDWAHARIKADAHLAAELAVCREYRIPLSAFHAWPDRDQDLALAQYVQSLDHCPGCGAPTEAMKNPALVRLTSKNCLVCLQKHRALDDMPAEMRSHTHLQVVMAKEPT